MSRTITFTPLASAAFYTPTLLNALFTELARVLNEKLDSVVNQTEENVLIGTDQVQVDTQNVVVGGADMVQELPGNINLNTRKVINIADGTEAKDAISVRQALTIKATF